MMEPYRPLVDHTVARLMDHRESVPEMTQPIRAELLETLTASLRIGGERRNLFDALSRTMTSLVRCISGEGQKLDLPEGFVDAP